jgi:hypothetical protein
MRLGLSNVHNQELIVELKKDFTIIDLDIDTTNPDAMFFDWIPNEAKFKSRNLEKQNGLVEKCYVKKIPMVVFDRYLGITIEEYRMFRKAGSALLEPALDFRPDFTYLPFSIRIQDKQKLPINPEGENRKYSLISKNVTDEKIPSFEKYVLPHHKTHGYTFYSGEINKTKEKEYFDFSLLNIRDLKYSDAKTAMILGSTRDYKIGYLDQSFFDALKANCIPLLPSENRYYNFYNIKNSFEIPFYYKTYSNTHFGFIFELYERIKENYPEMTVEYASYLIKYCLK